MTDRQARRTRALLLAATLALLAGWLGLRAQNAALGERARGARAVAAPSRGPSHAALGEVGR